MAESLSFDRSLSLSDASLPPGRPLPAQALDHASGFLLAAAVIAALARRAEDPHTGAQRVTASLVGVGLLLRGLGQRHAFRNGEGVSREGLEKEGLMERGTARDGSTRTWVGHAARSDGEKVLYDRVPSGLDEDAPSWR